MKNTINVYDPNRREIHINYIKYIEGQGNYSLLHLINSKSVMVSRTILKLEGRLPTFIRIYRKYLVNSHFIASDQQLSSKNLTLTLTTGEVLPVSRRRVAQLIPLLTKLTV